MRHNTVERIAMIDPIVCNSKVFYDTEFEAERAAAIVGYRRRQEFEAYQCGKHWHIAHSNPEERNKYPRLEKKDWCEVCEQPINPNRYQKHIQTGSHKKLQADQDDARLYLMMVLYIFKE